MSLSSQPQTGRPPRERQIRTDIPARLDRLPWSTWHWLVVIALGITWILDGLEVTVSGAISGVLLDPRTLGLTGSKIGMMAGSYLSGAVLGALFFGYLTDRLGRKKLFFTTLAVYLVATALTGLAWDFWSILFFRFWTGAGIGGEYSAINSAIDELIPARVRGRTDLIVNSTFWIGTAVGSAASVLLLDERFFPINVGWRLAFMIGAFLGLIIIAMRRFIPESPRWLITHARPEEADLIVHEIEEGIRRSKGLNALPQPSESMLLRPDAQIGFISILRTILSKYRKRSVLGLTLMISQAFFYNGVWFTYPLVLVVFYKVRPDQLGFYLLPFAVGNFLGPLTLGRFFDTVGRKAMITATYALSAILLAITAWLFAIDALNTIDQTILFTAIFFIASSAASSAYLTVSEIFPVETRAMAIALFYAIGTGIGGVAAPPLFGYLVQTGSRHNMALGYLGGAALLFIAAIVEALIGVSAERKSLEEIAPPLSSEE